MKKRQWFLRVHVGKRSEGLLWYVDDSEFTYSSVVGLSLVKSNDGKFRAVQFTGGPLLVKVGFAWLP